MTDKQIIIGCPDIEDLYKDMLEEDIKSRSVVHNEDDEPISISKEESRQYIYKLLPDVKPMTVGDLREVIKDLPDDTPVKIFFRMILRPHKVYAIDYDEILDEVQICI